PALRVDREPAGGAVEHQQLAEVEEADEPQLAAEIAFARHQAASRAGGAAWPGPSRSRLLRWPAASSVEMTPLRTRLSTDSSMLTMPSFFPVWMTEASWNVLRSRIRDATALLAPRISSASTRPVPSLRRSRRWASTPFSDSASIRRICACFSPSNESSIRSTVWVALIVWSVPK